MTIWVQRQTGTGTARQRYVTLPGGRPQFLITSCQKWPTIKCLNWPMKKSSKTKYQLEERRYLF